MLLTPLPRQPQQRGSVPPDHAALTTRALSNMNPANSLDGFAQVLHQVPSIRNLLGLGGTLRCRLGVRLGTVPADYLDSGIGLEPRRHGLGVTVAGSRSMTSLRSRSTTMVP
jgi:hypothetical protein